MKILHLSDIHLGAYVGPQCDDPMMRMANTMKCMDAVVETAKLEQPDIILVTGDLFHTARVWSDRSNIELRVAADYISRLKQIAPVAVLYGTPNHDSMEMFNNLSYICSVDGNAWFYGSSELCIIQTKAGPIQVAGLPGFDKGHFRAQFPGMSAEEENQVFTQLLETCVQGLSAQVDPTMPAVLMAHHTVIGCELDNGQHVFQANEVVLKQSTLTNSNFDLICLGHIHRAQCIGDPVIKPIFYAGSIDAFTFNDEEHYKGFWLHEMDDYHMDRWRHKFVDTPAREFITEKWTQGDCANAGTMNYSIMGFENKVVRILYTCDAEAEKALDKKKLERDLYAAGAYYVSEIRPEKIEASVNRERLHEKLTVWDCLRMYLIEKNGGLLERIYLEEAEPIIAKVSAAQPAGSQTGIFLPVEIEVRNYRSYAEEKLSFQEIFFAMVNGRNGSGKSSLFMDAIVDCLYEQPREGDLTGWIRNGEKSGSISFTFQLGTGTYRVTRTRQRSGKATLSLSKEAFASDPGEYYWEDHSCQKLADTQESIQQLLGMDYETFRSCVLIMQDQYGRFMEAKPEDRMGVLASLLGLGVYELLEEEAKKVLQEANRERRGVKDEIATLEAEVEQADKLQDELSSAHQQLHNTQVVLATLKEQKDEAAAKVATLGQVRQERDRLIVEAGNRSRRAMDKGTKLQELSGHADQTISFLEQETFLNEKHVEFTELREKLIAIDGTIKLLNDKSDRLMKLNQEGTTLDLEKHRLTVEISRIREKLQGYAALHKEAERLASVEEELMHQDDKKARVDEIGQKILSTESKLTQNNHSIKLMESQAAILQNANCIDIDQASCGFLKAAKQAAERIASLQEVSVQIQSELNDLISERDGVMYDPGTHNSIKVDADKFRRIKQRLASADGDQKLIEVHSQRLEDVELRIQAVTDERDLLEVEIKSLQVEVDGYEALKQKKSLLQEYENQWQQIPAAKQYLETISPQLKELQAEIDELNESIKSDNQRADVLSQELVDGSRYESSLLSLNQQIAGYEAEAANLNRTVGSLEEKLVVIREKKQLLNEKLDSVGQLASRASRLQVLSEAFSQDGIPHQIIRDIVPELEASANEILGQMTGGRMRMEFRTERTLKSNKAKEVATLDIVIIDVDNGELPYLSRSGGQKVRAALAVSFALAMVKASRVGLQLGMLFVDEPPFLDADGVDAYCITLHTIHQKYPDMRIVAISHDEHMKAQFPQQITIDLTENGSRVRVS